MKSQLEQLLVAALRRLDGIPDAAVPSVERTRDGAHGDYASKVAMRLAKATGKEPREVAQAIVGALPPSPLVAKVEVAANGFINFFLAPAVLAQEIRRIHELADAYGRSSIGAGKRTSVAVLTNPRDVLQARYAAYSESLANVLAATGYDVQHEALADAAAGHDVQRQALTEAATGHDVRHQALAMGPAAVRSVTFHRGGVPVQVTTLRALRDEVSDDACRFFFLMRSHEQSLDFDLKLATTRTIENPLFAVQYAHARVASAMKEVKARGISFDPAAGLGKLERLDARTEQTLIATLPRFPEEVESAAANCAPHGIVYYLREVANAFHTYYAAEQWIVEEVDLRNARLALVLAAGQVLRNGLALIGVSAPESL